ncbi:EGF-like domain-containing protein 2 [Mytilus trossulus]|uniref:EGF-like domain-containing protein 2 n=1 Tax=Mytilus trossulus TaxID=6551 RepID=UPI00300670C0
MISRTLLHTWLNFMIIFFFIQLGRTDFHCRRKGFNCKSGGICNAGDGSCSCPATQAGYDCSLDTDKMECDKNPCESGGTCYEQDKCFCSPDYYGERCQYKTVTQECLGSEIQMRFVVPDTFRGEVYLSEDEDNCKFNQMKAGVPGLNKTFFLYSLTIPFNSTDNVCSQSINKTKDEPMEGDVTRFVDVVVSYNPMFISSTDSIIIYSCIHKGSNFTMFAELDDVGLNERTNLKKNILSGTYLPVKFAVQNKDGQPLDKPLFVGDIFKLLFFLADTDVYESLRIDNCIANNTLSGKPLQFEFVKDGCPTEDGKNIMVNTDGPLAATYRKPGSTEELPASELFMYAFKFKGTTNVGFNCAVKICKKGEGSFCKPRDCSLPLGAPTTVGTSTPVVVDVTSAPALVPELQGNTETGNETSSNSTQPSIRRKRDSNGDRQFVSAILTIKEPSLDEVLIFPNIGQENIKKGNLKTMTADKEITNCVMSQNIIIVIVVLATWVFVLVVISSVLAVSKCRSHRRIQILKSKQSSFDFNYTIPRPKLNI